MTAVIGERWPCFYSSSSVFSPSRIFLFCFHSILRLWLPLWARWHFQATRFTLVPDSTSSPKSGRISASVPWRFSSISRQSISSSWDATKFSESLSTKSSTGTCSSKISPSNILTLFRLPSEIQINELKTSLVVVASRQMLVLRVGIVSVFCQVLCLANSESSIGSIYIF